MTKVILSLCFSDSFTGKYFIATIKMLLTHQQHEQASLQYCDDNSEGPAFVSPLKEFSKWYSSSVNDWLQYLAG